MKNIRICLFGNTCNNNFALLRYLDRVGLHADLALYSDEGLQDKNPNHNPELDTHDISQYIDRIHRLDIPHRPLSLLLLSPNFNSKCLRFKHFVDRYDICIGSGITPSLFKLIGRKLDIFYSHATGVEWLEEPEHLSKSNSRNLIGWLYRSLTLYQKSALKNNVRKHYVFQQYDKDVLSRHGIQSSLLNIPTYYPFENLASKSLAALVDEYCLPKQLFDSDKFHLFAFMRQHWVNEYPHTPSSEWALVSKRNDVLIKAFHAFLHQYEHRDSFLYLTAWGKDVSASHQLIAELQIESNVVWLPFLPRKVVVLLLQQVADCAVGQLTCTTGNLWGSTTWECIAHNIPCIQSVSLSPLHFEAIYGYPLPPLLFPCHTELEIATCLKTIAETLPISEEVHHKSSTWYELYKGTGPALTLKSDILEIYTKKSSNCPF